VCASFRTHNLTDGQNGDGVDPLAAVA
jgi:hypothetical protein